MRGLTIFQFVIGCVWALAMLFLASVFTGISTLLYLSKGIAGLGLILAGPAMLIGSSIMIWTSGSHKYAGILSLIGAAIFTFMAIYTSGESVRGQLRQGFDPVLATVHGVSIALALMSDVVAYKIYRGLQ